MNLFNTQCNMNTNLNFFIQNLKKKKNIKNLYNKRLE